MVKTIEEKFKFKYYSLNYRCSNKKHKSYKDYGGRGIKCEWKSYEEFEKDMFVSYIKHVKKYGIESTSIDRINNDGNYCKENCRWATKLEQNRNRKKFSNTKCNYKGVCWNKRDKKWRARIRTGSYRNKTIITIFEKYFKTELEAVKAYNKQVKIIHGKFAYINIINTNTH